ncbi:DUF790 family protein [Pyrinomonas sp.]|uniref:DUF790 family protein n=1 Tax=Pyrinomonas sp. TaxID=2080306 RepID=UPI0033184E91
MLTAELAMSWRRGDRTGPRRINPDDAEKVKEAADLIAIFRAHVGKTRAELEASVEEYAGTTTDYKTLRGLAKLLTDRCQFETVAVTDPSALRRALFLRARHPRLDAMERRHALEETAAILGCSTDDLLEGLYADLEQRQKLRDFDEPTPRELIDRYNLAQAQALLYRCVEMKLEIEPQEPTPYRELFNAIKAYRLIHRISGDARRGYVVTLDGPVSLFHRSQKYGIQMAAFLPALLACRGWRMRAEIETKAGERAFYELDASQHQLRPPQAELSTLNDELTAKLASDWERKARTWRLVPTTELIQVGETIFAPDFLLLDSSGQRVYLEVLGFWTPRALRARLDEYQRCGFRRFVIALSEELRGSRDQPPTFPPNVVSCKTTLDARRIEEAATVVAGT